MPLIFGIDIAELVADGVAAAGGLPAASLRKVSRAGRDAANPTLAGTSTTTTHACEAVVEAREIRDEGAALSRTVAVATIIGGSISPVAVPAVGDELVLDGTAYKLVRLVSADPAEAAFEFEVT